MVRKSTIRPFDFMKWATLGAEGGHLHLLQNLQREDLGEGGRRPMLALILVEHLDGRRAVFHPLRRDYCWLLIGDGSLGGKDDPCKTIP